ncbi:hypothetical protein A3Q41_05055 (plasmid) [Rhodococcoides fascians]|uniref:Rv3651-like N-terminal domain-containing protein n=1 Tax=Rhodococcoides fascians TaxID=1828 RepID=A0A143QTH2_RHOFA|nr:hypothetical protein A3Q41_05055 [Rhodococcus fascians]
MDIVNSWHLVETLVPGQMTVISTGGKVRDWTKIDRLSPGPEFDLRGFLELTRSSCSEQDVIFKGRRRQVRIRAVPVLGPSGETHGIQVWVGDPEVEPDPVRTVSGIAWLLETHRHRADSRGFHDVRRPLRLITYRNEPRLSTTPSRQIRWVRGVVRPGAGPYTRSEVGRPDVRSPRRWPNHALALLGQREN